MHGGGTGTEPALLTGYKFFNSVTKIPLSESVYKLVKFIKIFQYRCTYMRIPSSRSEPHTMNKINFSSLELTDDFQLGKRQCVDCVQRYESKLIKSNRSLQVLPMLPKLNHRPASSERNFIGVIFRQQTEHYKFERKISHSNLRQAMQTQMATVTVEHTDKKIF